MFKNLKYICIEFGLSFLLYIPIMFISLIMTYRNESVGLFIEKFQLLLPIIPSFITTSSIFFYKEGKDIVKYIYTILVPTIIYTFIFIIYYINVLFNMY